MCNSPYRDAAETNKCVTPGCDRPAEFGGLCEDCYEAQQEAGREYEAELEAQREFNEYHPAMPRG